MPGIVAPATGMQSGGMIPVLRLDHARAADGTFAPAFLDDLRSALHEVGFLQLTDYGAAPGQIAELTELTRRFFALPLAERLALDNRRSPHFRGYTRLGHEITAGRPDAREQLDFGPEQQPLPRAAWDAPFDLLRGPNQWPDALPELAGAVDGVGGAARPGRHRAHPRARHRPRCARGPLRRRLRGRTALVRQAHPLRRAGVRRPGRPRRRPARRLGLPHAAAPGRHRRPAGPAAALVRVGRRARRSTAPS